MTEQELSVAVPAAETLIPTEGIVKVLPFEYYAEEPAINSGMLTMYCRDKTPAHIKAKYIEKKVKFESDDLDFGKNAHTILLEPELFRSKHIVIPEFSGKTQDGKESKNSKEAKDKKKAWFARLPADAIPVDAEDIESHTGMLNQLLSHGLIKNIFHSGSSEISGFWIDKETGVRCKFRADYINGSKKAVIDYKTARDASTTTMLKEIEKRYYDVQLFHYAMGCRALGIPIEDLIIVAQEKEYPYLPNTISINELLREDAEARWRSALNVLAKCFQTGVWPGYPEKVNEVGPTNFRIYKEVL